MHFYRKIKNTYLNIVLQQNILTCAAKILYHIFFALSITFDKYFAKFFLNKKKCAAEATHEKCITPLLRRKFLNIIQQNGIRKQRMHFYTVHSILLNNLLNLHRIGIISYIVSFVHIYFTTFFNNAFNSSYR